MAITNQPPTGLQRWLFRFPILFYRLGLGWLLGGRFMLINHIGRKTGKLRQAVVEVVSHDQENDVYYAASGWGYNSNWYRNLMAHPDVTIQVGRRKLTVHAATVSPEIGAQVLLDYRAKHSFAANQLGGIMGLDIGNASAEELADIVSTSLPIVAFRPLSN